MRRWFKRIAVAFVVLLALAIATLAIAIHTEWGRGIIKDQVEAQLAKTFIGGGRIGRLDGSPFTKLIAHDIVINGPDGKPAITIASLTVDVDLLPLISRRAIVNELAVDTVTIIGTRDEHGELQLGKLMRPAAPSQWNVELRAVTIRHATLGLDGTADYARIDLDDVAIDAVARVPSQGAKTAAAVVRGAWRQRGALFGADLTVALDARGLVVPSALVRVDGLTVAAFGVSLERALREHALPQVGGVLVVAAPRLAVARLAPSVQLWDDVVATIQATPRAPWTHLEIRGAIGAASLVAVVDADLAGRQARGTVATGVLEFARVTRDRLVGTGATAIAFDARLVDGAPVVHALVGITGELADLPRGAGLIAVELDGDRALARVAASGPDAYAVFGAALHRAGDVVTLERMGLVAATTDPAAATGGKAPVRGRLRMDLTVSGQLTPMQELAVRGSVEGHDVRFKNLRVSAIHGSIDARGLPAQPVGTAKLRMAELVYGETQLGALGIAAVSREDGKLAVAVRSQPKFAPWMIDADALVTLGETVRVELGKHRVRGAGEDWTGSGGRVTISPARVELRDLRSTSAKGTLAAAGVFERRTGDLTAHLETHGGLGAFDPAYRGDLDAVVDITRRRTRWGGRVALSAKGVALDPRTVTLDGKLVLELRGRELGVDASISTLRAGSAKLALAVETPADITDVAAWQRLDRAAIREVRVAVDAVNLEALAMQDGLAGRIDGALRFSATETSGMLEVRGLKLPQLGGTDGVNATLCVTADGSHGIASTLIARIPEVGGVEIAARLAVPAHLFDPGAWQALGANALRGATVRVEEIAVDPGMLQRFGIISTLRARVALNATIGEGARTVKLAADVRQLRGDQIAQPLDVHVISSVDERAASTTLAVTNGGMVLLTAKGSLTLSLAELIANPRALSRAPLAFDVTIPKISASTALATFGHRQITAGTLTGKVIVGGSIAHPTVKAAILAANLQVPSGPGNTPVRHVERLTVIGDWDGLAGTLRIDGVQRGGGMLNIVAKADLLNLAGGTVSIVAKQFDLVPILAFAPGPAGGASGRLDANLTATGLDPMTTKLVGFLHLTNARIPLAPNLGTLRRAEIDVRISDNKLDVKIDGRLGAGTVKVAGSAALEGNAPISGDATITLRSVSPIGAVEPRIDMDITTKLKREHGRWNADVVVARGKVIVPDDRGDPLDPVGAPDDMVFASEQPTTRVKKLMAPPSDPVIVAKITIHPIYIESTELRGDIRGQLTVSAGHGQIGIVGDIEAQRGDLELFGRRYTVERGAVHFDGSIDPILDVRVAHDFSDVTTVTEVRGRLSKPELVMSADPGIYSQGQLLGFLLGGEPGGDPSAGNPRDGATSAGASAIANKLGGYVKGALPIDLDVLRYESATASSSASVTVGTWLTRSLFLAYRRRLEARPDENAGEGEVEYWLTRKIVVEGVAGDRGYDGVDLLWRHRY